MRKKEFKKKKSKQGGERERERERERGTKIMKYKKNVKESNELERK